MAKKKFDDTTQFAALPWRIGADGIREVMLLTSPRAEGWVIPTGWPAKGRKPTQVAAERALLEAGLIGQVVGKRPVGNFHYEKRRRRGAMLCQVWVFLFRVERQLEDWPGRGLCQTKWFDADDAEGMVEEGGLAEIIANFAGSYVRFVAFHKSSRPWGGPGQKDFGAA